LITGSTDGIGLEFATQLAKAGYNLLLVSRTASKLESVASALQTAYPGSSVKTLAVDFAAAGPSDYAALKKSVDGLDVGILINNVGRSHDIPVPFSQTPEAEMAAIVDINVAATLRVTAIVLPGMIARKRGLILTMGSFGGLLPTPLLATYSGSKAFLQQWSSALGSEVAPYGITVELVQSYLVTSAMSKIRRASATIPTPKAFVRAVLSKIGRSGGAQGFAYTSTPFWSHAVMQWALGTFTGFMGLLVVGQNKSMHEAIRKRALKKQEREKARKAQ
jgi:17beta-estradiol 17-dehydrogenase / very-long-chain 3-oxoacyl-CoA reductase